MDIGSQYKPDDDFKAAARLFQSRYRANVLGVDYQDYGNRLADDNGQALLNYYDKLNCRQALRERYPSYSRERDADMLRSEHIPFNLLAPLDTNRDVAVGIIQKAFGIECVELNVVALEHAPKPKGSYLSDGTSFDAYLEVITVAGSKCGIGIEVKYTEQSYKMKKGSSEEGKVLDHQSPYWRVARSSGSFINPDNEVFGTDPLRQVWRNHLLGLKMVEVGDVDEFYSITLFPCGNKHFQDVLPEYVSQLVEKEKSKVIGCTFEDYISAIEGSPEVRAWKEWLEKRYIIK